MTSRVLFLSVLLVLGLVCVTARGSLFDGERYVNKPSAHPHRHHHRHGEAARADAPQVEVSVWDFVRGNNTITCEQLPTPVAVMAPVGVCWENPWPSYWGSESIYSTYFGNYTTLYIEPATNKNETTIIYFYMWADAECTELVFGGAQATNSMCFGSVNLVAPSEGPFGPAPPPYPPQGWIAQTTYNDVFHCSPASYSTSTLTPFVTCEQNVDGTWSAMYCDAEGQNVTTVQYLNSSTPNCNDPTAIITVQITPPGCSTGNLLVCPAPGGPPPPVPPTIEGPTLNQMVSYVAEADVDATTRPSKTDVTPQRHLFDDWEFDRSASCGVQIMNWFSSPLNMCMMTGYGQNQQAQVYTCDGDNATVQTWLTQFDCSGKPDQTQVVPLGKCLSQGLFYMSITTCNNP